MNDDAWRKRLDIAVRESGRSAAAVSVAAGMGRGYIHSILKEGKDPSISNLVAICNVLGVSLSRILYGFDIDAQTEELLTLIQDHPDQREGLLKILRKSPAS